MKMKMKKLRVLMEEKVRRGDGSEENGGID